MTMNRSRLLLAAMYRARHCLVLLAAGTFATFAVEAGCSRPVVDAIPMLEKMERAWEEVHDYAAVLLKTERFTDGTITDERAVVKFRKPNQLYLHVLEGANAGAELLYPKPGTDNVTLGRPGGVTGAVAGFLVNVPAIGLLVPYEFDLDDSRLMDGQHHPLPDPTIAGMLQLISLNLRTAARHMEGSMCFHPGELVDGHRSIKIEVLFPSDSGIWHTVVKGETLWSIGGDYGQDRYVVMYNNPSIDPENVLPPGERIFVPRYYAARAQVWISESFNLPVKLQMFDVENRVYESYSYVDLRIDIGLTAENFDPVLHGFPVVTTLDEGQTAAHRTSPVKEFGVLDARP
ncbi:MAG: DUF1571 domain-containing protein [Lysobacterales bacterium]|nr:MAG: DUF1571 domain-containing protein [Xanthomonadales bacterium]